MQILNRQECLILVLVIGFNMKNGIKISLVLFSTAILYAFAVPEKKIQKLVDKVWKEQTCVIENIILPDSLAKEIGQFCAVKSDGKIVGYACYTTAFGCRIGGCAVASNPNALTYETFDYVVVYDENLKIKKIDIASYSGDYGYQICNPKWLTQFVGQSFGFKLNENIDGISGATVSVNFLIDDVNAVGADLMSFLATKDSI